jgi:DNA polymerase-3 subunit gamma/tau
VHKVPVTVVSRCQRFALRRVPAERLIEHYARVAAAEAVEAEPAALALIARAADGSVRDGLSLLDQAIALSAGGVTELAVRDMLGGADRGLVLDLLETVLRGDPAAALDLLDRLYRDGADPLLVLQQMLDLGHFLTRLKLAPDAGLADPGSEGERARARPLADKLSMPVLARLWQMLLKGLAEVQAAPSPIQAAEMVLIRLAYVADLPAPGELVAALQGAPAPAPPQPRMPAPVAAAARPAGAAPLRAPVELAEAALDPVENAGPAAPGAAFEPMPRSFDEVVALFDRRREAVLRAHLVNHLHLVRFEPGRIEFRPAAAAPRDLANRLGGLLGEWTGTRWMVAVSEAEGEPSLREQQARRETELKNQIADHPLVRAVLDAFPGATIAAVREHPTEAASDIGADPENADLTEDDR